MNKTDKPISDKKRYILRLLEMAKQDRQIADLMPNQLAWEAAAQHGLTCDKIIATFLKKYVSTDISTIAAPVRDKNSIAVQRITLLL